MDINNSYTDLEKSVELLMNAFNNILFLTPEELVITPTRNNLEEIKNCLNRIFPDNKCLDILYTHNYDKLFFGIRVNPTITQSDLINIIANEDKYKLGSYKIEFDSKLFNMGLSPQELTAYILYEISSMVCSYQTIDELRVAIDLNMTSTDDVIYLRDSVQYAQLVIYAVKDSLTKLSSLLYKDSVDEYMSNSLTTGLDLNEFLISAHDTIIASDSGPKDSLRASNVSILQWVFIMYRDMRTNSGTVMSSLKDAKTTTGSKLDIEEINKTIDAINRIDSTISITTEGMSLNKFFDKMNVSSINEFSLFSGLKRNGLRSIEDYLFEASLRIKNLETEEDAIYVMRSLSTRMNILADYIYNTPGLSDAERRHWESVYERYARLREELVKKRIWNKKQYGLFFDYNQDFGDKPYEESADQPMDTKDAMTQYTKDQYEKLAGDSSRWNKITQPDIDISEKDIETELESISFDEDGSPVVNEGKVGKFLKKIFNNNDYKSPENKKSDEKKSIKEEIKNLSPEEKKAYNDFKTKKEKEFSQVAKKELAAMMADKEFKNQVLDDIKKAFDNDWLDKDDPDHKPYYNTNKVPKVYYKDDGSNYIEIIDGDQAICNVCHRIVEELAKRLENTFDIKVYTGDGDEGCIYPEFRDSDEDVVFYRLYKKSNSSTNESTTPVNEFAESLLFALGTAAWLSIPFVVAGAVTKIVKEDINKALRNYEKLHKDDKDFIKGSEFEVRKYSLKDFTEELDSPDDSDANPFVKALKKVIPDSKNSWLVNAVNYNNRAMCFIKDKKIYFYAIYREDYGYNVQTRSARLIMTSPEAKKYHDYYMMYTSAKKFGIYGNAETRDWIKKYKNIEVDESTEVCTNPKCEEINDEKEKNYFDVQRDGYVDSMIDSESDIDNTVSDDVPESVDDTIPDINESIIFGDDSSVNEDALNEFLGFGKKKEPNKAVAMMKKDASDIDDIKKQQEELRKKAEALKAKHEANEACCENCGSSNVSISEDGKCTCGDCGSVFNIANEMFDIEPIDEFKSDIKQAYNARLAAEKQSGKHDGNAKDRITHAKGDMSYGKGHHATHYDMDDDDNMKAKQVPNHDQLTKDTLEKATTKTNLFGQKVFKMNGKKVTKADEDSMQRAENLNKTVKTKADYDARQKAMKEVASDDLSVGLPSFL